MAPICSSEQRIEVTSPFTDELEEGLHIGPHLCPLDASGGFGHVPEGRHFVLEDGPRLLVRAEGHGFVVTRGGSPPFLAVVSLHEQY